MLTIEQSQKLTDLRARMLDNIQQGLPSYTGLTQNEIKEGLEALRSNRTASQVAAKKAPKVAKKANLVEIDTKLFTDMDLA